MRRLGLTRKVVERIVRAQDQYLRSVYLGQVTCYSRNQLVFVDETGCDRRTAQRTHGYNLRGVPLILPRVYEHRGIRYSAMTVDEYLAVSTHAGSITADIFMDFVHRDLLPQLNAFPVPRSVVVLDNASIHDVQLKAAIRSVGARYLFLSPYSADLNPIECSYDWAKDWLRRNDKFVQAYADATGSLQTPLKMAFSEITPELCEAWFHRSYI
eukprot:Lithocolla_globosa_v1_NODE_6178_length_1124_cov_39.783910.p1 type:complete len:212 gc:universal NODE_6178_length_1124_cov_39.783910:334-969(+)